MNYVVKGTAYRSYVNVTLFTGIQLVLKIVVLFPKCIPYHLYI